MIKTAKMSVENLRSTQFLEFTNTSEQEQFEAIVKKQKFMKRSRVIALVVLITVSVLLFTLFRSSSETSLRYHNAESNQVGAQLPPGYGTGAPKTLRDGKSEVEHMLGKIERKWGIRSHGARSEKKHDDGENPDILVPPGHGGIPHD